MTKLVERLQEWLNEVVVVDSFRPFVVIGTLRHVCEDYLELTDADLHDLGDTETTRELYIVKSARHGVAINRAAVVVRLHEVFAVSPLADVEVG